MTSATQDRGRFWEQEVSAYLRQRGLSILENGYRCRVGELDIVCCEGETLVIVEVRARARAEHGGALASVDERKRRKIVGATRHYLMRHPERYSGAVRFDVVGIDGIADRPKITWVKNAFETF